LKYIKKRVAKVAKEEVNKRSNNKAFRVVIRAAKKAKVTRDNRRYKK
jgi:hypothetical protein